MVSTKRKLKGFTVLEVTISVGIFAIIMLAVTQIFTAAFGGYRETRLLQRNIENAQFAMNSMAKELRTSSVVSVPTSNPLNIHFIDYSQNAGKGKCIAYWVDTSTNEFKKWARNMNDTDPNVNRSDCGALVFTGADYVGVLVKDVQSSGVYAIQSQDSTPGPRVVGRVTVQLRIGVGANMRTIQSSVSLRDFNYVGI